jgi:hypothetical protein
MPLFTGLAKNMAASYFCKNYSQIELSSQTYWGVASPKPVGRGGGGSIVRPSRGIVPGKVFYF